MNYSTDKTIVHEVDVTDDYIMEGFRASCSSCPVALAIKDSVGMEVEIDSVSITLRRRKEVYVYHIMGELNRRIKGFDEGHGMEPFTMYLRKFPHIIGKANVKEYGYV